MVCEWGMSERIGPLTLEKNSAPVFLGMQYQQSQKEYSESTAKEIDEEIKMIITQGYKKATELINNNLDSLENLAKALLEHETIDGEEVDLLIKGASLKEVSERRQKTNEKLDKEQRLAAKQAEEAEKAEKEQEDQKKTGEPEEDPLGDPGTVTA